MVDMQFKLFGIKALLKKDKKSLLIKHLPMNKIGINIDNKMNITGYWFCFDWQKKQNISSILSYF